MNKNNQTVYSVGIGANLKLIPYLKTQKIVELIGDRSELIESCFIRKNTKNDNRFLTVCETSNKDNFFSVLGDMAVFFNEQYQSEMLVGNLRFVIGVFMKKDEFSATVYFEHDVLVALSSLRIDLKVEMYPWSEEYS
jgi:hypothetical protein